MTDSMPAAMGFTSECFSLSPISQPTSQPFGADPKEKRFAKESVDRTDSSLAAALSSSSRIS